MRLETPTALADATTEAPLVPGEPGIAPRATGLPLADGMSLSYWLQGVRCDPLLDHRTTADLPASAEVVIIGSGITGTLAALTLLESANPPESVVIIEAREFCSGATGRNAGHCRPDQYRGFRKFSARHGPEQAIKILNNERQTWERLVDYVRRERVECDLWVGQSLECSMTDELAADAASIFDAYTAAGGKVDHITRVTDSAEAEAVSRLKGARAFYAWQASTLYPWKLVAHVARKALGLGLNLQTWTPVTSVKESSVAGQWDVHTSRGTVTAPTVLFATNAYTGALLPETRGPIRPTPHMCNKVIPPSSFSGSKALQNSYSIVVSGGFFSVNTRPTSDGVVLFGGSNPNQPQFLDYIAQDPKRRTDDGIVDFEPVTDGVRAMTGERLGWDKQSGGANAHYDSAWSGIIGLSADEVPFIGAVPGKPGLWLCAGHHGHGMARIFTAAPAVVALMRGASWADTGLPECFEVTEERLARLRSSTGPDPGV